MDAARERGACNSGEACPSELNNTMQTQWDFLVTLLTVDFFLFRTASFMVRAQQEFTQGFFKQLYLSFAVSQLSTK